MTAITNAQLVVGRLISDTPDQGVIAGEKPDGSTQNLLVADAATGDVTLPTFGTGGAHHFGGDVVAAGAIYVDGNVNVRDLPGGPHTHTFAELTVRPTDLAGYGITDAYTRGEVDASLAAKSDTGHTHAWADLAKTGSSLADLEARSAADLTSGTLPDARVAQSNVTQHQSALALAASQIISGALPTARGGTGLGEIGAPGQVLAVNAAGSALEFATPSGGASGALDASLLTSGTVPAARLAGVYPGITGAGVLGSGAWEATPIGPAYGGTGLTTYAAGDLVYASGTASLSRRAAGSEGEVLTMVGGLPEWAPPSGGSAAESAFVGARVYQTAGQSLPAAAYTSIQWTAESYDADGFHDLATNNTRLTIPTGRSGRYLLHFQISMPPTASVNGYNPRILKNGATEISYRRFPTNNHDTNTADVTAIVELVAGDYVEYQLYQNNGAATTNVAGATYTYGEIALLGASGGGLADGFTSIANDAGVTQFSASGSPALRLAAVGGLGLAFDSALRKVTIGFLPKAPTGLTAQGAASTSIALAWVDASDNETGFEIERSLDSSTGWTSIHTTAAGATAHTDTGLTSGVTYHYRVRAVGPVGSSAYSGTASSRPASSVTDAFDYTRSPLTVTDTGHTYNSGGGTWSANGSTAGVSNPGTFADLHVNAGYSNGSIELTITFGAGVFQLIGRSSYLLQASTTGLTLYSGSGAQQIGSWAGTISSGSVVKLTCDGSTIQAHVAGVQRISVTDTSTPSGTTWGVRASPDCTGRLDNLAIHPI